MKIKLLESNNRKSLVLVTVLIFIFILTIIAGALFAIVSSQAKLDEARIRRQRAIYVAEAGIWRAIERAMGNDFSPFTIVEEGLTANVTIDCPSGSCPPDLRRISCSVTWSPP